MKYSKYYTPIHVANFLITQLEIEMPEEIIDICCGSGNLLIAAQKRWNSNLTGVDIIEHNIPKINCICEDGREFAINHKKKYPLILANPPFDCNEKKRNMKLCEGIFEKYHTRRLENEMLIANLRLLEKNGTLLIIMPSSFVEADINLKLRQLIAFSYNIQKIIKLPDDTFGNANIRSYAIIIKNEDKLSKVSYLELEYKEEYDFSKKTIISKTEILEGRWHPFIKNKKPQILEMKRGNISSQFFKNEGIPILHTSKKQEKWEPSIRHIGQVPKSPIYTENGDIIVSRIGRSAGSWAVHKGDKLLISDCLYRIKDPKGEIAKKLKKNRYSNIIKGVATPYITMKDFNEWYQSI